MSLSKSKMLKETKQRVEICPRDRIKSNWLAGCVIIQSDWAAPVGVEIVLLLPLPPIKRRFLRRLGECGQDAVVTVTKLQISNRKCCHICETVQIPQPRCWGTVPLTMFGLLLWSTPAWGTGEGDGEWEGAGGVAEEGEHMGEVGRERLTACEVDGIWSFRQPPLSKAGEQRSPE